MTRRHRLPLALLAWLLLGPGIAVAEPVTLDGITFDDEMGGLVVTGGSGSGTRDDPFVVHEDIADDGAAILTIKGLSSRFGNRAGTQHLAGFVLVKTVRNRTRQSWNVFELELRERLANSSTYEDGLSFAQDSVRPDLLASDRFASAYKTDEPLDSIVFEGGTVAPGETVTLRMVITDYSPNTRFYLLQRRNAPVAMAGPERR